MNKISCELTDSGYGRAMMGQEGNPYPGGLFLCQQMDFPSMMPE